MASDANNSPDRQPIALNLAFPQAPAALRASQLSRAIASVIYLHDVAAIRSGEPSIPPFSGGNYGDGNAASIRSGGYAPSDFVTSDATGIPAFRPRFSPRLARQHAELRIARIGYGSPLLLSLVISNAAIATTFAASLLPLEKYLSLPSRVHADRAENDARRAEAEVRRLRADADARRLHAELDAEMTLQALKDHPQLGFAEAVRTELEDVVGPPDIAEIGYADGVAGDQGT